MKFLIPWNGDTAGRTAQVSLAQKGEVWGIYGDFTAGPPADLRGGATLAHLFDALCFNNREFTRPGQKELRAVFDNLARVGIGAAIVANPYLALWIRRNYPAMRLSASCAAGVDSVSRARWWEDLGVETITLPDILANRDLEFIRLIRRSVRCRLQLLANSACRTGCPWRFYRCWGSGEACRYGRVNGPAVQSDSCFIRPEEAGLYENAGIDSLQIGDEKMPADTIARTLEAYISRSCVGDPADLFCPSPGNDLK